MRRWAILIAMPLAVHAASPQGTSAFTRCETARYAADAPVPFCALTVRPMIDTLGPLPELPGIMQGGTVGGSVRITATLDTNGRLDRGSARVSPLAHNTPPYHALIHNRVMAALSSFRFTPGMLNGRKVRTQLDLEVHEPLPASRDEPQHFVVRQTEQTWGIDLTVGYEPMVRESPPPRLTPTEVEEVWRAVVAVTPLQPEDTARVHCVGYRADRGWRDPSPAVLDGNPKVRLAALSACPPTYGRMFAQLDSLGNAVVQVPPPGYQDPVRLTFDTTIAYTRNSVAVWVGAGIGTASHTILCSVTRERSPVWGAECRILKSLIS